MKTLSQGKLFDISPPSEARRLLRLVGSKAERITERYMTLLYVVNILKLCAVRCLLFLLVSERD